MTIEGRSQLVYGSVALLSADNLASSATGGFKEGGTAYRFCRQCLTTDEESKQKVIIPIWYVHTYTMHFNSFSFKKRTLN